MPFLDRGFTSGGGGGNPSIDVSALNIGDAAADRWVVACAVVAFRADGGNPASDFASSTIGGASATLLSKNIAAPQQIAFYKALVPSGTTATVNLTANGDMWGCFVAVATFDGEPELHAAAYDRTVSSNTWDVNVDAPDGGALLAVLCEANNTVSTWTWTGATKDFDFTSNPHISCASAAGLSAESGRLVRCVTNSNFNNEHGLGAITLSLPSDPDPDPQFRPQLFGGKALVVGGKLFGIEEPA